MTTTSTGNGRETGDINVNQVVEEAVENTPGGTLGLKLIVGNLISALAQFIVYVARGPITLIVNQVVERNFTGNVQVIQQTLRADSAFIAEIRDDVIANIECRDDTEIARIIRDEVARQVAETRRLLLEDAARHNLELTNRVDRFIVRGNPTYPFAWLLSVIGLVLGGFGTWIITLGFKAGTISDSFGQEWVATTIAAEPNFAYAITAAGAFALAGILGCVGVFIDTIRNRRR